jgi:hypothetical protein
MVWMNADSLPRRLQRVDAGSELSLDRDPKYAMHQALAHTGDSDEYPKK